MITVQYLYLIKEERLGQLQITDAVSQIRTSLHKIYENTQKIIIDN